MKIAVLGVQRKGDKLWFAGRDFDDVRRDFETALGGKDFVEVVSIEKQDEHTGAVDESTMARHFAQEHKNGQIDAIVADSLVDIMHLQHNVHTPRAITTMPTLVFGTRAMEYDRRVPQPRPEDSVFRHVAMFADYDAMVSGAKAALSNPHPLSGTDHYNGVVSHPLAKSTQRES